MLYDRWPDISLIYRHIMCATLSSTSKDNQKERLGYVHKCTNLLGQTYISLITTVSYLNSLDMSVS
jgi:hypothetical protein